MFEFGPYRLDPSRRVLTRGTRTVSVTARTFDVLLALLERAGETVEKDELLRRVWPDTVVEEANLSQQIFTIRKLLGQTEEDSYIATVPRRGYRFVAPVRRTGIGPQAQPQVARRPVFAGPARLAIPLERLTLASAPNTVLAVDPNGSRVVFAASDHRGTRLYQRQIDRFDAAEIPGTEGATNPFFSPDGQWLGFQCGRTLQKIALSGGPPVTLCDVADVRGACWTAADVIVFAPGPTSGLWTVPASGGPPRALTAIDYDNGERTHRWPHPLPDGRGVLFTVGHAGAASFDDASLAIVEPDGSAHRLIVRHATDGRYSADGQLLWARGGVIFAAAFDLEARVLTSPARPVVRGVAAAATGASRFAISNTGTLVHVPGEPETLRRSLVVVDRAGEIAAHYIRGEALEEPRLSPDGTCVVVSLRGRASDLWLYDVVRGAVRRATFEGENFAGIWGPEAGELTFSSSRSGGPSDLYVVRPDRPEHPTLLVASEFDKVAGSWSRDGSRLLFTEYHPESGADIWLLDRQAERATPFVRTTFNEYAPALSPDGRFVAYTTDESGRPEIQVVTFPEGTGRRQLSTEGGTEPLWSSDGRELYYRNGPRMMRIDMSGGSDHAGIPATMFERRFEPGSVTLANYDVRGGEGFLMVEAEAAPTPSALLVTLNWLADLPDERT